MLKMFIPVALCIASSTIGTGKPGILKSACKIVKRSLGDSEAQRLIHTLSSISPGVPLYHSLFLLF